MEVTILALERKQVETKYGEKTKVGIKTDAHGEKWISGFENAETRKWAVGDKVQIEIEQRGKYTNFKTQSQGGGGLANTSVINLLTEIRDLLKQSRKEPDKVIDFDSPEYSGDPDVQEEAPF